MALVAGASETEDYVPFALALDRAAKTCGVNFIGGYSALVQKGMTAADEKLDPLHPGGAGPDGAGMLVCERWLHQGGHQHGRRGPDGPHHQGDGGRHSGPGRSGLCQAGGVLQRGGGQSLHGRCVPRCRRGGKGDQCGRLRSRCGASRLAGREGAALRRGGGDESKKLPSG